MKKRINLSVLILLLLIAASINCAQADEVHKKDSKGFNTAEFIFDHVSDSYEWHILTVNHHHISIPLPVILYSKTGLHVFLSNKFHYDHGVYKVSGLRLKENLR